VAENEVSDTDAEPEPSRFALAVTAACLFTAASYVTACLVYALVGTGIPLSPLAVVFLLIPSYMLVIRVDERLEDRSRAKDRLLVVSCFGPLVPSVALVLAEPLPVFEDSVPRGGAFGVAVTACVVVVVLLVARAQWVNRERG
jgi:hypothetical protein